MENKLKQLQVLKNRLDYNRKMENDNMQSILTKRIDKLQNEIISEVLTPRTRVKGKAHKAKQVKQGYFYADKRGLIFSDGKRVEILTIEDWNKQLEAMKSENFEEVITKFSEVQNKVLILKFYKP